MACLATLWVLTNQALALDLRKDLSLEQFESTGLSKLSDAELASLQAILDAQSNTPSGSAASSLMSAKTQNATAPVESEAVPESSDDWKPKIERPEAVAFTAELIDSFSGRSGRGTSLELNNGQVWQQTDSTSVSFNVKNRQVRLRPAIFGWRLMFLQNNQSVSVRRIR
jgi:hypothetical protein